ncbi:four helix bundle protein [Psychroflexus sp. CAK8W]|uniref:Four helix bundle protein n=1 Tax=Psychroflexus longus TaxID=2873596 RepID=A0ABS7XNH5_9FLAO|nr:four helix bundle protein [Psychroflexus longus]
MGYAIGSAAELDTQIIIAKNLKYIDDKTVHEVFEILEKTRKLLSGYKKYVKTKY